MACLREEVEWLDVHRLVSLGDYFLRIASLFVVIVVAAEDRTGKVGARPGGEVRIEFSRQLD